LQFILSFSGWMNDSSQPTRLIVAVAQRTAPLEANYVAAKPLWIQVFFGDPYS